MSITRFVALAKIPLPKVKSKIARIIKFRRPKILEIWAKSGCKTIKAMTKELAIYTYCFSPPISRVIVGKAITTIIVSRPKINKIRQRARNTHQNRHECDIGGVSVLAFNAGWSSILGIIFESRVIEIVKGEKNRNLLGS